MNYLGIDPSTKATGYCVMNDKEEIIEKGVLKPDRDLEFGELLLYKYKELSRLMEQYEVVGIGCEDQFNGVNPDTFKKLCRVTGLVQMLAAQYDVPIALYAPASWRKLFHGTGKAKKKDTLDLVNQTYQLTLKNKDNDIADAIGIASARVVSDNIFNQ